MGLRLGRSRASSETVMLPWRCQVWTCMVLYTFHNVDARLDCLLLEGFLVVQFKRR